MLFVQLIPFKWDGKELKWASRRLHICSTYTTIIITMVQIHNGPVLPSSPSFKGLAGDWQPRGVRCHRAWHLSLAKGWTRQPDIITHTLKPTNVHRHSSTLEPGKHKHTHTYMYTHFIYIQNSHWHPLHTHTHSLTVTHMHTHTYMQGLSQFQRGWWGGIYSGRRLIESEVGPSCRSVGLPRDDKLSTSVSTSSLNTNTPKFWWLPTYTCMFTILSHT